MKHQAQQNQTPGKAHRSGGYTPAAKALQHLSNTMEAEFTARPKVRAGVAGNHTNTAAAPTAPKISEGTQSAQRILRQGPRMGERLHRVDSATLPATDSRPHFVPGSVHTKTPAEKQAQAAERQPREEDFGPKTIALIAGGVALLFGFVAIVSIYGPKLGNGF